MRARHPNVNQTAAVRAVRRTERETRRAARLLNGGSEMSIAWTTPTEPDAPTPIPPVSVLAGGIPWEVYVVGAILLALVLWLSQ